VLSGRLHDKFVEKKNKIRFAGGSDSICMIGYFYHAYPADFVDLAHPVFLYAHAMSRTLSCNFPGDFPHFAQN
jgi:hypothetical protein